MKPGTKTLLVCLHLNLGILAFYGYAMLAPRSILKTQLLPGTTSHGHYQIELDCSACHDPASAETDHSSANVMQDACIRCHGEELEASRDTHPASKFNDPTNADRLEILDAQNCLTCHREHVPDQTIEMGLTMPLDYCWHCHKDVAESRPSHEGMAFDTCASAGCHNYHDNTALYEKFLDSHFGEPDFREEMFVPSRDFASLWASEHPERVALGREDADVLSDASPSDASGREDEAYHALIDDWAETGHASVGVNCRDCHQEGESATWSDTVSMQTCAECHVSESESFVKGKHGMRLGSGFTAMTPSDARLPMHPDASHASLTCNACHPGHRFDAKFAATEACKSCHADAHSLAFEGTSHAALWNDEVMGNAEPGSGVSCATCHMPRQVKDGKTTVNHNQNAFLRPNETMAREVCLHCHGLEFSLRSLADPKCVDGCFGASPLGRTESVDMAHNWFEQKRAQREERKARLKK